MTSNQRILLSSHITMVLILSLTMCIPSMAHAIAIYDAITLVDLSITGAINSSRPLTSKPRDLLISGNASVVDADAIVNGNAFADQFAEAVVIGDNTNDLDFDEGLSQQAIAVGDATLGLASSFAFTQGILRIINTSATESYRVDFEADWTYFIETSITDPLRDFPSALSEIRLESTMLGSLLDISASSDSVVGGALLSDIATFPFSVSLNPGDSDLFTLTVNAAGIATATPAPAPVPEPSTFSLMGIGILGLAWRHWRQRRANSVLETQTIASKA